MKTIYSGHLHAAEGEWERRILDYQAKYKTNLDLAYMPAFQAFTACSGRRIFMTIR